jgi:hypothetical protein
MHWTTNREQREIAALIARHEREGVSWAELSRSSGISVWRLRYREQRAKAIGERTTSSRESPASGFVPVSIREHAAASSCETLIEIETPAGYRLRVPAGIEPESLRRVLEAITPSC